MIQGGDPSGNGTGGSEQTIQGEFRAILRINNNQRGETSQDNHAGRHRERQIE